MPKVERSEDKIIKDIIKAVNMSLTFYKKGGLIDCRRTPDSDINYVNNLTEFVDARFNRECWDIPCLNELCEMTYGRAFIIELENPSEEKRKFDIAKVSFINPNDWNDSDYLKELIDKAEQFFGGSEIIFYSYKSKIKFKVDGKLEIIS